MNNRPRIPSHPPHLTNPHPTPRVTRRALLLRFAPVALPGQTFVLPNISMRWRAGFVRAGSAPATSSTPAAPLSSDPSDLSHTAQPLLPTKTSFSHAALSLLFFALLFHHPAIANPAPGDIRVLAISESGVQANIAGLPLDLSTGTILQQGCTLQTGPDSSVQLFFDNGHLLEIGPDSRCTLEAFTRDPFDTSAVDYKRLLQEPTPSRTHIILHSGRAIADVRKLANTSLFEIQTPTGPLRMNGAACHIAIDPSSDDHIEVSTATGLVEFLHASGKRTPLPVGKSVLLDSSEDDPIRPGTVKDSAKILIRTRTFSQTLREKLPTTQAPAPPTDEPAASDLAGPASSTHTELDSDDDPSSLASLDDPETSRGPNKSPISYIRTPLSGFDLEEVRKRAERNDPIAQIELGHRHRSGKGFEKSDYPTAAQWYLKASQKGVPEADMCLGRFHLSGMSKLEPKSWKNAFEIWKQLSKEGSGPSQYFAGLCYQRGLGTRIDHKEAFRHFLLSSENPTRNVYRAIAMHQVATLYESGQGTPRNKKLAVEWMAKAAKERHPAARRWLETAAEKGDRQARAALALLNTPPTQ